MVLKETHPLEVHFTTLTMLINKSLRWTKDLMSALDVLHRLSYVLSGKIRTKCNYMAPERLFTSYSWCVCVCVSDGKRKTVLEASAGDVDREGPAAVWQYATHERTLAQPDTHLPSACHTVHTLTALLLSFCSFIQTHLWKANQGTHTCIPFCLTRASLHTHFLHASWQGWPIGN